MALNGTLVTSDYDGRYYKVTWEAEQSIVDNTSTITWTLEALGGNNSWYAERTLILSIDGKQVYSKSDRIERKAEVIASAITDPIPHDSNGRKTFVIELSVAVYYSSVNCKGSSTFSLDDIPRQSTFSTIKGDTIGSDITVNISRNADSFTHQFWYKLGNSDWYDLGTGHGTSIKFQPDMALCSQLPNSTSGTLELCIRTFNGTSRVGSDVYKNITVKVPESVCPSVSISVSDATDNYDTYGSYIKGKSKLSISLTGNTSYSSPIASYSTTVDGRSYSGSSITTDYLYSTGTIDIKTTVKDKRGRTGSTTTSIEVIAYGAPIIEKLVVKRCDSEGNDNDQGEYAKIIFSTSINRLGGDNSVTYTLYSKQSASKNWDSVALDEYENEFSVKEAKYIIPADSSYSYDIKLELTDNFATVAKTTSVSTAYTLMHWLRSGLGMAVGKIAELNNVFDIGFKTKFSGGILQDVLEDNTDLDTLLIPNTYYVSSSRKYTNTPEADRGMTLEILGNGGAIMQRATINSKTNPAIYERFYYSNSWGNWMKICDFGGAVLWSGNNFLMNASQTINLSKKVSEQKNGIVLVFSLYLNGETKNENFSSHFVAKKTIETVPIAKTSFFLCNASFTYIGCKTLDIYDDKITGYDQNTSSGTANGVTYKNNNYALRYVIGV